MNIKIKNIKIDYIEIFLIISLFAVGIFHEFLSCIVSLILCIYIAILSGKNGGAKFTVGLGSSAIAAIVIFYGISELWAIDRGTAFIGSLKFLPLLLFSVVLMQSDTSPEKYLGIIPITAVSMTVISFLLSLIPILRRIFIPADRLAGFFEYSNTYALFALLGSIISVTKERIKAADIIFALILLAGIFLSGSRTVFALTIVSAIAVLIFHKNKKLKLFISGIILLSIISAALYAFISGNFETTGRFLTSSFTESTFVGRILYFYDALPVILHHPFGLGYEGYYYLQTSFQSGVYSVRYIHNDFLQLMLDVGFIPAIALIAAILHAFFKKGTSLRKRLLLFVISAHSCFDFDLQFIAIFMVLILLLDVNCGKAIKIPAAVCNTIYTALGCISIYMGISLTGAFLGNYRLSYALYPWNTDVNINLLMQDTDAESMDIDADRIISQNKYVPSAYSAKAEAAYSRGNFAEMMEYKDKAIRLSPFDHEEYIDYIYKLLTGAELYKQAGDTYSSEICMQKAFAVLDNFYSQEDKLSRLGKMIDDQPVTEVPPELQEFSEEYKKAAG